MLPPVSGLALLLLPPLLLPPLLLSLLIPLRVDAPSALCPLPPPCQATAEKVEEVKAAGCSAPVINVGSPRVICKTQMPTEAAEEGSWRVQLSIGFNAAGKGEAADSPMADCDLNVAAGKQLGTAPLNERISSLPVKFACEPIGADKPSLEVSKLSQQVRYLYATATASPSLYNACA